MSDLAENMVRIPAELADRLATPSGPDQQAAAAELWEYLHPEPATQITDDMVLAFVRVRYQDEPDPDPVWSGWCREILEDVRDAGLLATPDDQRDPRSGLTHPTLVERAAEALFDETTDGTSRWGSIAWRDPVQATAFRRRALAVLQAVERGRPTSRAACKLFSCPQREGNE